MSVALLGVPFDGASSFQRGAAKAPPAIRAALHSPSTNNWSESLQDMSAPGLITDAGDLVLTQSPDPFGAIQAAVSHLLNQGHAPLVLGGDHSITLPVLRALRARHRPLTVLHVDAHPDLYDEFEGDQFSHACPFARVMEEELADRLVQVGIRTMNRHQRTQADRFGVEIIEMKGRLAASGRRRGLSLAGPGWAGSLGGAGRITPGAGRIHHPPGREPDSVNRGIGRGRPGGIQPGK